MAVKHQFHWTSLSFCRTWLRRDQLQIAPSLVWRLAFMLFMMRTRLFAMLASQDKWVFQCSLRPVSTCPSDGSKGVMGSMTILLKNPKTMNCRGFFTQQNFDTLCLESDQQVYQSMRLHFARRPLQCHYVKVMHVTRPSRALLESTRDKWISENGSVPAGNDNGELQNIWENPLDCKPVMTGNQLFSSKFIALH